MKVTYKFFRYKNGLAHFAVVGVECWPAVSCSIEWDVILGEYENVYRDAVYDGIMDAVRWHRMKFEGGNFKWFVHQFVELFVDTKVDAVRCAATLAAWKALGHDESGVGFLFRNNWQAHLIDAENSKSE